MRELGRDKDKEEQQLQQLNVLRKKYISRDTMGRSVEGGCGGSWWIGRVVAER